MFGTPSPGAVPRACRSLVRIADCQERWPAHEPTVGPPSSYKAGRIVLPIAGAKYFGCALPPSTRNDRRRRQEKGVQNWFQVEQTKEIVSLHYWVSFIPLNAMFFFLEFCRVLLDLCKKQLKQGETQ